jgi:hypothetical protein
MKYKLDVKRDVDTDEPGVFILNLHYGWKFNELGETHVRGYDSMKELRHDVKYDVIPCDCKECSEWLSSH